VKIVSSSEILYPPTRLHDVKAQKTTIRINFKYLTTKYAVLKALYESKIDEMTNLV
jgi:hypothetical protein